MYKFQLRDHASKDDNNQYGEKCKPEPTNGVSLLGPSFGTGMAFDFIGWKVNRSQADVQVIDSVNSNGSEGGGGEEFLSEEVDHGFGWRTEQENKFDQKRFNNVVCDKF